MTWESFDGKDPSQIIQYFGVVPLSPMSTIVAIMQVRLTVSPDQSCLSAERNRAMLYFVSPYLFPHLSFHHTCFHLKHTINN